MSEFRDINKRNYTSLASTVVITAARTKTTSMVVAGLLASCKKKLIAGNLRPRNGHDDIANRAL